eukprot:scaffold54198_cov73-Phaeocystis_antarctica.AAC.2
MRQKERLQSVEGGCTKSRPASWRPAPFARASRLGGSAPTDSVAAWPAWPARPSHLAGTAALARFAASSSPPQLLVGTPIPPGRRRRAACIGPPRRIPRAAWAPCGAQRAPSSLRFRG